MNAAHSELATSSASPYMGAHLASPLTLVRNAGFNLLGTAWALAVLILAMPRLFAHLGATAFGLFSLAWIVIGYLGFLDIGVNRAATKFVSQYMAEANKESANQIACTAVAANCFMGIAGGLAVLVVGFGLCRYVFHTSPILHDQVPIVIYTVALAVPLLLIQGVFRAVLSSFQKFGLINGVDAIATTLQWGAASVLAWKGTGVGWVVMSTVGARIICIIIYGWTLHRLLPDLLWFQNSHLHGLRRLAWFGGWVTVSQMLSPLLAALDRLLIASFLSLEAVTLYFVPSESIGRIRLLPNSLAGTLYPAFSERGSVVDIVQLRRLYERSVRYLLLLLLPATLFLLVLGPDLFSIWMGPPFARQTSTVVRILAVGILANALAPVPYNLLQAVGHPDITGKLHLLEVPLYLIFCLALIPHWGIAGAATASTLRFTLDSALLFWAAHRHCECSLQGALESSFFRIVALNSILALLLSAVRIVCIHSWSRILFGLTLFALSLVAGWLFETDSVEKPRLVLILKALVGKLAA